MSEGTYLEEPHANRDTAQSAPAVRLYRFFNLTTGQYGVPFALCDEHRNLEPIPQFCHLERIRTQTPDAPCERCAKMPQETA